MKKARELLAHIDKNFGTLAWCRRWIEDQGQTKYLAALKNLIDEDLVQSYEPLVDIKGSFTAQFEVTYKHVHACIHSLHSRTILMYVIDMIDMCSIHSYYGQRVKKCYHAAMITNININVALALLHSLLVNLLTLLVVVDHDL
jgi:hypothetical protein